MKYFTQIFR